jgi:hypothetical protein
MLATEKRVGSIEIEARLGGRRSVAATTMASAARGVDADHITGLHI